MPGLAIGSVQLAHSFLCRGCPGVGKEGKLRWDQINYIGWLGRKGKKDAGKWKGSESFQGNQRKREKMR